MSARNMYQNLSTIPCSGIRKELTVSQSFGKSFFGIRRETYLLIKYTKEGSAPIRSEHYVTVIYLAKSIKKTKTQTSPSVLLLYEGKTKDFLAQGRQQSFKLFTRNWHPAILPLLKSKKEIL